MSTSSLQLRKMKISVSFQLIFCSLFSFSVNFLLSFQLIPNGLGHFLLINLISCLTRIWVFQLALPSSEIISAIYISLAQILLRFFGGGGVGQRCCCVSPRWKLPPAISASRRSYPPSAEKERKVSADPTIGGAEWSQRFHF